MNEIHFRRHRYNSSIERLDEQPLMLFPLCKAHKFVKFSKIRDVPSLEVDNALTSSYLHRLWTIPCFSLLVTSLKQYYINTGAIFCETSVKFFMMIVVCHTVGYNRLNVSTTGYKIPVIEDYYTDRKHFNTGFKLYQLILKMNSIFKKTIPYILNCSMVTYF